ncbi:MAG: hypothetical protein MJE77_33050 [Proteobacteria bacterium]|nr:hypothetical protein [Pseudomonadota bacterium]
MSLDSFLGRLAAILERVGVEYMVVGSLASTAHGIARTTHDIDIVVALSSQELPALLDGFSPDDYYVSDEAAREAIRRRSQFNIIDMETGWKADLVIQKQRPFSIEELRRRQRVTLLGQDIYVATAEDTIIAKLEWARHGQSERQLRDIAGIIQVKGAMLDIEYIERWVSELDLADTWKAIEFSSKEDSR